jgi:hypothetical protein
LEVVVAVAAERVDAAVAEVDGEVDEEVDVTFTGVVAVAAATVVAGAVKNADEARVPVRPAKPVRLRTRAARRDLRAACRRRLRGVSGMDPRIPAAGKRIVGRR